MTADSTKPSKKPEMKFGPFAGTGGLNVAIWSNTIQTDNGARQVRSITIAPRRYQDAQGQWKDSKSFRPSDLPALIFALQQAQEYMITTPIEGEEMFEHTDSDDIPF